MKAPALLVALALATVAGGAIHAQVPATPGIPPLSPPPAQPPSTTPAPVAPTSGVVRLRVEQESKSDNDKNKKVQKRTLKITLTNSGPDSLPLRVKYAFFGRSANSRDTVVIDHSDLTTQLQPKSDQTLTTATQSATLIEEHFDKKKKVAASGQRFTGYGVKVYHNGNVIAEACDPPSMQDDLAKMPGLPAPKAKPVAKPAGPAAKPGAKPAPKPAPKPQPAPAAQ